MGRQKNVDMTIIPDDVKNKDAFKLKDQETKSKEEQKRKKEVKVEKIIKTEKETEKPKKKPEEKEKLKKVKPKAKKVSGAKKGPAVQMRKKPLHGKRYRQAQKLIDKNKLYSLDEALKILPQTAKSKFTESVETHLKLNIKKGDQGIRGTVKFPHSTGKVVRVAALTAKPAEAKKAGAAVTGSDDLIEKIKKGKIDFDVLVAEPQMMAKLAPLAKILGPKGLMPNPKSGTISQDVAATIKDLAGGKTEFKSDGTANIHMMVGKTKDSAKILKENIKALIEAVGINQIKNITLCSTMGPGIKIDIESLEK